MKADRDGNTIYFGPGEAEGLSCTIADINCWLNGFVAAGGDMDPINLHAMRNLNIALKDLDWRRGGE